MVKEERSSFMNCLRKIQDLHNAHVVCFELDKKRLIKQNNTRQVKSRQIKSSQDKTTQIKITQDKSSQDKSSQDKSSQDKIKVTSAQTLRLCSTTG